MHTTHRGVIDGQDPPSSKINQALCLIGGRFGVIGRVDRALYILHPIPNGLERVYALRGPVRFFGLRQERGSFLHPADLPFGFVAAQMNHAHFQGHRPLGQYLARLVKVAFPNGLPYHQKVFPLRIRPQHLKRLGGVKLFRQLPLVKVVDLVRRAKINQKVIRIIRGQIVA